LKNSVGHSTKKVAFVAHCLVNQNAKVAEFARLPGVVYPVVDLLRQAGYVIEQLPCPETLFMGLTRWWTTKEIYDNPGYRRHCASLAKFTADVAERYHRAGYEIVLVGLDGSPSSGVRFTGSSEPVWGGRPNARLEEYRIVPGRGIWIEELLRELYSRGIKVRATGIPMDSPDFDMDRSVEDLARFLK
jgi:predicted secreted protein